MSTVRVIETIHHGDTHGATHAEAGSLTEALRLVLEASPYPNAHRDKPEFMLALWDELLNTGKASRGWCDYTWMWL